MCNPTSPRATEHVAEPKLEATLGIQTSEVCHLRRRAVSLSKNRRTLRCRCWRPRSCTLCAPSARHRDGSSADACGHRRCPLPLVPACAVKRGCSSSGCAYWCPTSTTPSHAIRAGRNRCVAAGLSTRVTLTFHQHELTTLVLMPCGHLTQSSPLPRCPLNHGPALRNDQC